MKTTSNLFLLILSLVGNLLWSQNRDFVADIQLENYDYPFPVKSVNIMVQEQNLSFAFMEIEPEHPNGKSVLLLHGKNFAANYWEQTARDLAAAGYRVVMPDQIGFGKSSKPTNIQYSFQLLAQNTKYLLDALLVKKVNVIGHSMGGMLATRFALMYPETVEKLILENPIGLEDWKTVVPYQSIDAWNDSELKQDYDKLKKYQIDNYYGGKWKPEYEKWLEIPAGWTRNLDYGIIAKNSALTYDMIFTQPVVYEFENLKMPMLLIIGQRDRTALGKAKAPKEIQQKLGNYPALGKSTAAKIKNCKLVEIDNVGHLPHIEAYEKFLKPVLEFLK
jgi:pimeloyl-ACP methyl ester carboxylesterase